MKTKTGALLLLFFAVLCLSTAAIFVKLASAPSGITAFYRLLFASISILPMLVGRHNSLAEFQGLTAAQWRWSILSGLLLAAHYVLWFESMNYTSVTSSVVMVTLQPLFSFVGSYFFFHERYGRAAVCGCLIAIAGCMTVGWGDWQISGRALLGDLMALTACAMIVGYFFIGQLLRRTLSVVPYSFLGYLSSAVFLGLYSLLRGDAFCGYPAGTWLCFLGLALVPTLLGLMVFNWLLKYLSATVVSMSILGETVGTCVLSYLILHERIAPMHGVGIGLILLGLGLFLFYSKAQPQTTDREAPRAAAAK